MTGADSTICTAPRIGLRSPPRPPRRGSRSWQHVMTKKKWINELWYGDNLTIMQGMGKHAVDLIYLDPPFNSKQNYNLLYKTMTGKPVPEQVEAFCDTWAIS